MSGLTLSARHRYPEGFELEAELEAEGGVTAVFGPSGSGKSTVLRIAAGILRPLEGRVSLGGATLLDTARGICLPPEKRRIGLVFQDHRLFPHLSVEGNLRYGLRRRPARRFPFERVVEVLELGGLLERDPASLSGGERQRVALGRAILRGPELLLLDEPLAAVDAGRKDRILAYLERAVSEWSLPTLLVSHDQADVRRLADRVVVLEAGRVVASGPTASTLDRAVISAMRSAPGPVNVLRVDGVAEVEGHLEGSAAGQRFQLPAGLPVTGAGVYVQFLPKDVTLARADVSGLSVRNHLRGAVREVAALPGHAYVAVDLGGGQAVWAEVTLDAVRELGLAPGREVVCLIKTTGVEALGGSLAGRA